MSRLAKREMTESRDGRKDLQAGTQRSSTGSECISIVGSGRMATALGVALSRGGIRVLAVISRVRRHAMKCARLINGDVKAYSLDALEKLEFPSNLIIAVSDDAIIDVSERLAGALPAPESRSAYAAVHTSGALSSHDLLALQRAGFSTGSLHPLISIADPLTGAGDLSGAYFCLEGQRGARRFGKDLVSTLGARSFSIKTENKPLYHAAAVMTSGNMVALFDIALEMIKACGLSENQSRTILLPLVESTVSNLKSGPTSRALTGAFARGDLQTVIRHLQILSSRSLDMADAAYRLLGSRSIEIARRNAVSTPPSSREILELLNQGKPPQS
jgi:predicted short-subunit dehydrogenase-like oxidoreductase (DUF2520 family)